MLKNIRKNKKKKNESSIIGRLRGWFYHGRFIGFDIQSIIMTVLTALTIITTVIMGLLLYNRFKMAIKQTAVTNTENMVENTVEKLDADLLNVRQITNAVNYNIIQEYDISSRDFNRQFSLLYEINADKIQSMALYDDKGNLLTAEPVTVQKDAVEPSEQDWYQDAEADIENIHFSIPHIQNLFVDGTYRYYWVVSLSRSVDINDGEQPGSGVLLVDMKYSVIEDTLARINDASNGIYYYLCSRNGQMIYHPRGTDMDRGYFKEEYRDAATYEDGTYELTVNGRTSNVIVNSVAYTGWKVVGVVPESVQIASINRFRYYIITTVIILMMMLLGVNRIISKKISRPILKLNESVKAYEAGGPTDIYIGGSSEIRHLGYSVQKSYEQIEALMQEIIREQTERRKSEMDALQSQINPHFLYNSLSLINWKAIEYEQEDISEITLALSNYYRTSLNKGKNILSFEQELSNMQSYLKIQQIMHDNSFDVVINVSEEVMPCESLNLILQPLVENAIDHGIDLLTDRKGVITVEAKMQTDEEGKKLVCVTVSDNGVGMDKETAQNFLTVQSKGYGARNVNDRIRLYYGESYHLEVQSIPDEGTTITIKFPAKPYNTKN